MKEEILKTIKEKGILIEKELFDLLYGFEDIKEAKNFIEQLERYSGQKIITKSVLNQNIEFVKSIVNNLSEEKLNLMQNIFVKLGISLEIRKESSVVRDGFIEVEKKKFDKYVPRYEVICANTNEGKKLEVADFVGGFRARYQQLQRILMQRNELQNLISIGKISSQRQNISIIGIVTEKRITKNKNLVIKFEDLTGEIVGVVKLDKEEVFKKARDLQLDDVVGVKGAGNKDMIFVFDIIYPDVAISEKVKFEEDISIAFLSDLHAGSKMHLGKNFEKFLSWINSENEYAKKIKYLFFVGDNVDGVGIFPNQESFLEIKSIKEQYGLVVDYLKKIPNHITIFMCPGQHDASRVAEPQPAIEKKYAEELYKLDNLVLVTNPALVKIFEGKKEFKVLMYHGASIHGFINEIQELRESKAHSTPARAVKEMLKRRHLAPTHSSVSYIPNPNGDFLVINEVPDILATGEVHRLDIENYNGVLIITGSCWQSQTPFEEKMGNVPDPCKVPVYNLKTRELKIFDFWDEK
ncbi:MAG: metallophosphoesterase [Candidatus Pacearchaeota archaeon]|nr:metallophosphoesterase [Candidatus Pacearchaeota archaeon]